jgi:hypothetical protein
MSLDTDFNVNPYYDDYNEDKKFLRVLFKPGFAVQARELTQLQTILQKQVERFGNHVFKNGSMVSGGSFFLQNATYIKLDSEYAGSIVSANNFVAKTIVDDVANPTKRAEVIRVYDANPGTGDPRTLMVKQIFGSPFTSSSTIYTTDSTPVLANISTSGVGTGQVFSVDEGVFFYEGFFIKNDAQSIATSKYDNTTANARIGFEVTESIVTATSDTSLLDPAQLASNYQAPGADRFKISLVLNIRSLESTDDSKFIELARVENGVLTKDYRYPLYAVLEDTLARRTFDESGNYTVRQFNLALQTNTSNTAQTDIILSPGKAYVYGYEFETIAPTTITIPKPRTTNDVVNKRLSADYGNYIYTTNHLGTFPINTLDTVDLHCTIDTEVASANTGVNSNTKIGTARVKTIEFDSASDTANANTYIYRTYLFDVNIGSITGTVQSAANATHVNIGSGRGLADNIYNGAKFRITSGPGAGESYKVITNYNRSSGNVALDVSFVTTPTTASSWSIDFEMNDAKSIYVPNGAGTSRLVSANVAILSKNYATTYGDTYLSDVNLEPLIFPVGENFVANSTFTNIGSFSYKRLFESQTFSSGSKTLSPGSGEALTPASTTTAKLINYQIIPTSGTTTYALNKVIPPSVVSVSGSTITVTSGGSMTANIIATIDVSSLSVKAKTQRTANTAIGESGRIDVFGNSSIFLANVTTGQTHISSNNVIRTPEVPQSLYVTDVTSLVQVLDFGSNFILESNRSSAIDVTSRYTLDSGQRNSEYNHASIKLKAGQEPPTGNVAVFYNRFTSTGAGVFTVDSYPTYENIPTYTDPNSGTVFNLRDSIDFRPVRSDATASSGSTVTFDVSSSSTGPKIPQVGSDIISSYSYYLPRNDKITLTKNRVFEVIQGVPSLNPVDPADKSDTMSLYVLRHPAYLSEPKGNTVIQYINNKRYTMKDIGTIERRIDNLEYYTALSLLEQSALSKSDLTILDSQNLPRFKNGIIVDGFTGQSIGDVQNADFKASIDSSQNELRPSFNVSSYSLKFDSANSVNFTQNGSIISVATANNDTILVDQPRASTWKNVNPFNVINYLGFIDIDPKSDVWVDTTRSADVLVNITGDNDAWALIAEAAYNIDWGSWQQKWTGTRVDTSISRFWEGRALIESTTQTTVATNGTQTRTGVTNTVVPTTITQKIGDRVIDVSIIPYMRNISTLFKVSNMKPSTTLYPFFDGTSVQNYVARANKVNLATNNLGYRITTGNIEKVNVYNNITATVNGSAFVAMTSGNSAFIVNVSTNNGFNLANANLIGTSTGTTIRITGYEHYSGLANNSNANTIQLSVDSDNANNITTYNGATIYIVAGEGAGQSRTISSYNPATRNVTISGTWTTIPVVSNSVYSIGNLETTKAGDVAGVFSIPKGIFRTGEKIFRLTDTSSGDIPSSSTSADATFYAQGSLQTKQDTILSATVPTIVRGSASETQVIPDRTVNSTTSRTVVGWSDPLAQTFLVSPIQYPQGISLTKIRVCFKTKDSDVPVTLQIRPATNGYPSSSVIYPGGSVTLTSDKVKTFSSTTTTPSLDNANHYTDFAFDSPVYLQPGEHSFVLLANSNKYEIYIAQIGQKEIASDRVISEQPYGGSLFLSQNGSTWEPEQNSDLMFRLFRNVYSQSTSVLQFLVDKPTTNVPYDLIHLINSDLAIQNTSITYQFAAEKSTGGISNYKSITPLTNYELDDGDGRRVLNPSTGNTTLIVKATMSTTNPSVTPQIDASRFGGVFVENIINDLPLTNSMIYIANTGSGMTDGFYTLNLTGGNGSGGAVTANVVSGRISRAWVSTVGSGYTTSPTINLFASAATSAGGYLGNMCVGSSANGASIVINGEDSKSGGPANVRYIMRKVTLKDGFDSGDLRVYLTANISSGSNIYVYYKLLSSADPDIFDNKNYQLMTQLDNTNYASINNQEYREITFAPGIDNTANNNISYASGSTLFTNFRTFGIKIVMSGTNTVNVPRVRDLRVIAVPAG